MSIITKKTFDGAVQCLIDNGIDSDEAETVMVALGYILCDEETVQFTTDNFCPYCNGSVKLRKWPNRTICTKCNSKFYPETGEWMKRE